MTTSTATKKAGKPYTGAIIWPNLEAGDFSAESSDGTHFYDGNIFTGACECPAHTYGSGEPCKHCTKARAEYWQRLDEARRERAAATARRRRVPLSDQDFSGAPGWQHILEPYYAPLELAS